MHRSRHWKINLTWLFSYRERAYKFGHHRHIGNGWDLLGKEPRVRKESKVKPWAMFRYNGQRGEWVFKSSEDHLKINNQTGDYDFEENKAR